MIGVAAALAGAPPVRAVRVGVLLVTFMVAEIGPLTDLPSWVLDLSPFTHLSPLPRRVVRARARRSCSPVAAPSALWLAGRLRPTGRDVA